VAILLVAHELTTEGKDYADFYKTLKEAANGWWHYFDNIWIVNTGLSADQFAKKLYPHMTKADRLLVVKLTKDKQGWLPPDAWEWLNERSYDWVGLMTATDWLTLALVLVTGFYAFVTYRILRANEALVAAMREQQLAMNRPYVQIGVSLRIGTNLLYLSIRNTGRTPAGNVRLQLDRAFHCLANPAPDHNIATYSAFSKAIDSLPSGSELLFLLGTGPSVFSADANDQLTPKVFSLTAEYKYLGQQFNETTTVDLHPFRNSHIPQDPVVDELERVRKSIDSFPRSMRWELGRDRTWNLCASALEGLYAELSQSRPWRPRSFLRRRKANSKFWGWTAKP
jgi:hypothetical protein